MSYKLTFGSVLILPKVDPLNKYETVVFNVETGKVIKLNPTGYHLLNTIHNHGSMRLDQLLLYSASLNIPENQVNSFLDYLVHEKIILEQND